MTWCELCEALETESLRLGIPLDHLEVRMTAHGRPVSNVRVTLHRDDSDNRASYRPSIPHVWLT